MTTTIYLQLKADLWWYGPTKARVLKYAAKNGAIRITGNVYELPEPFKGECLAADESIVDFSDTPVEVEYRELWPEAGGKFTPKAPFDYDIQRARLFKTDLKLTSKLVNAIKRAMKCQQDETR